MGHFRQRRVKANLELRAKLLTALRDFFRLRGYLEVETPCRIPAPVPEPQIEAVPAEGWFLHTSPELCMKRLLAAGYGRIFQICRCHRKHERGDRHLPEMTLLEWYQAGQSLGEMMALCEVLIGTVARQLGRDTGLAYQGRRIDLTRPWRRMTVASAFERYSHLSLEEALATAACDEAMGLEIAPALGWEKPAFLYDYPAARSLLARPRPDAPALAERFELYIGGLELCNACAELTDGRRQRRRFEQARASMPGAGDEAYPLPEKFLQALDDMPDTVGSALGVDRLVMLLADTRRIDDVVAFVPEEL
jgi:lysyl-tRNA synthetase class 2